MVFSPGNLPETIFTDRIRLKQVLANLIGNALKFTEHGTITVQGKMNTLLGKTQAIFLVTDTGCGIPFKIHSQIFEPFIQGQEAQSGQQQGFGLGLPLARRLARLLGGDVRLVASEVNKGSTFDVAIEIVQPHQAVAPQTLSDVPMTFLIVDDTPSNRIVFEQMLRSPQCKVISCGTGDEALAACLKENIDVVLLDLQMPGVSGLETSKNLRKQGFNRPIIAVTGHMHLLHNQKNTQGLFDAILTKPVDRSDLLSTVKTVMHRS